MHKTSRMAVFQSLSQNHDFSFWLQVVVVIDNWKVVASRIELDAAWISAGPGHQPTTTVALWNLPIANFQL